MWWQRWFIFCHRAKWILWFWCRNNFGLGSRSLWVWPFSAGQWNLYCGWCTRLDSKGLPSCILVHSGPTDTWFWCEIWQKKCSSSHLHRWPCKLWGNCSKSTKQPPSTFSQRLQRGNLGPDNCTRESGSLFAERESERYTGNVSFPITSALEFKHCSMPCVHKDSFSEENSGQCRWETKLQKSGMLVLRTYPAVSFLSMQNNVKETKIILSTYECKISQFLFTIFSWVAKCHFVALLHALLIPHVREESTW